MHLLAPFILQNFKQFSGPIQGYEDVPFFGLKMAHLSGNFFLVQTITITFIYLLSLFIVQNFKKSLQWIQSYEDASFLGPKWSICPKQKHFGEIIKIILIYLLAPFTIQSFKKILPADPELWGCIILESKMAHFPKWEFFQKTC